MSFLGQETDKRSSDYQLAVAELNEVLARVDSIRDLRKHISVKAKATNLSWARDPESSRIVFTKLWERIDKQLDDNSFDKEAARMDLLEQLYPKDRVLANRLVSTSRSSDKHPKNLLDTMNGTNMETRRLAFLSYRLAEEDAFLAARVLEDSLSENTAPSLPLILNRIRENNPLLANYVGSRALERISHHSPTIGLAGLGAVAAYLFPFQPSPQISLETNESDEGLRQLFMDVGYAVLKNSLSETDESLIKNQQFPTEALTVRKFNQALVAGVLLTLSPRYGSERFVELNAVFGTFLQRVPNQFRGLIDMQIAAVRGVLGTVENQETSEAEIVAAIAREDFGGADLLIGQIKDETRKKLWLNILFRAKSQYELRKGEALQALSTARRIENVSMAIPIVIDIAKFAAKKQDESLSINAFQDLQKLNGQLKKGMQAKTNFSLSAEMAYLMRVQSSLMLQKAVEIINGLSEIKTEQTKPVTYRGETYWDDPDNFLSSVVMLKSFSVLGELQLQDTLQVASKFHDNSLQLMARLAAVERILKKGPPKIVPKKKSEITDKSAEGQPKATPKP